MGNTYNPSWRNHPNLSWGGNQGGGYQGNQGYQNRPYNNQNFTNFVGNQGSNQGREPRANDQGMQNLERLMQIMMTKMDSNQAANDQRFSAIEASISEINVHRKMMETQIAQIAQNTPSSSKLPSQPVPNLRGERESNTNFNAECKCVSVVEVEIEDECKKIALRSGKVIGGATMDEKVEKGGGDEERDVSLDEKKGGVENESEDRDVVEEEKSKGKALAPNDEYVPKLPFPQRFRRAKLDVQFGKFLEILKGIYIDIPFVEAVKQMPNFVKFLKEFVIKRRCVEDCNVVNLSKESSDAIQNRLPPKLKDPGSFNIPTNVGRMYVKKSLCDLGASVSIIPMSLVDKIGDGVLKPSNVALKLADESLRYPIGVLEDVKVKVGKLAIPVDFMVLDERVSEGVPIILGRPFLATAGANIDVQKGRITFRVNGDECEFKLSGNTHQPMELVKEVLQVEASSKQKDEFRVDRGKKNKVKETLEIKEEESSLIRKEWKAKPPSRYEPCAFTIRKVLLNGTLEVWNRDLGTRNIKLEDAKVFIDAEEGLVQSPPIPSKP